MLITIDFSSDEAIYMQLRNQIIIAIATDRIREGDTLPSVRQLAETTGVNMHTVNKAYSVLKQEGIVKLDRRHGAVVALDINKAQALAELKCEIQMAIAKAICKNISIDEIHMAVEEIFNRYKE
ncbi:MAG: GntR family transcriptional regulator [Lachnospiraceae bacterium]|nr:GntR family transcriptional regulator [Lachnospiraceae bacterium]